MFDFLVRRNMFASPHCSCYISYAHDVVSHSEYPTATFCAIKQNEEPLWLYCMKYIFLYDDCDDVSYACADSNEVPRIESSPDSISATG